MKKPFNANPDREIINLQHELVRIDAIERSWFNRVVGIVRNENNAVLVQRGALTS
jgi:hypothetical protein